MKRNNTILSKNIEVAISKAFDIFSLEHLLMCDPMFQINGSFIIMSGFRYINADDIVRTFKAHYIKNTEDLWGTSTKIKCYSYCYCSALAYIFNKCVDDGVFPDLIKLNK